ncbi:hypothetical protein L1987_71079 [Smallanthus sonchifolius]|uniref:Uncharacterized protein n=1 Tax=Smallanthus sonchifolius TaxID=185202 RepID=A0ACB9ARE2_9ASTR|nr:hypothetical protein L1987_71079 [Smallanthus sonchifolius]
MWEVFSCCRCVSHRKTWLSNAYYSIIECRCKVCASCCVLYFLLILHFYYYGNNDTSFSILIISFSEILQI